jgi:hypothetical protein
MKYYIKILFIFLLVPFFVIAQDEEVKEEKEVKEKLERPAFESSYLIHSPTNVMYNKNTLEIMMQHRFGLIDETNSLAGIYGNGANIRIAAAYAIHERLTLGFGTTKNKRLQDFNWKVGLLRQTRSNKMPVSVSYYGNFTIDARNKNEGLFPYTSDRYSFYNELIVAKKFSQMVSLQVSSSWSHFNTVERTMRNDMIAISGGGRIKISPQTAIMIDYTQPLTKFLKDNPHPGISVGVEFGTSAHAFQLFITNYSGIVPQQNIVC